MLDAVNTVELSAATSSKIASQCSGIIAYAFVSYIACNVKKKSLNMYLDYGLDNFLDL